MFNIKDIIFYFIIVIVITCIIAILFNFSMEYVIITSIGITIGKVIHINLIAKKKKNN